MLDAIQAKNPIESAVRGKDLTASMNSLMHAKPDSAPWNLVSMGENTLGHGLGIADVVAFQLASVADPATFFFRLRGAGAAHCVRG